MVFFGKKVKYLKLVKYSFLNFSKFVSVRSLSMLMIIYKIINIFIINYINRKGFDLNTKNWFFIF